MVLHRGTPPGTATVGSTVGLTVGPQWAYSGQFSKFHENHEKVAKFMKIIVFTDPPVDQKVHAVSKECGPISRVLKV